jgi:hypothetical protein
LVSYLFGPCHHGGVLPGWHLGRRTVDDAFGGSAFGERLQEMVIMAVAYSSAPTGITSFALILWGLRGAGLSADLSGNNGE